MPKVRIYIVEDDWIIAKELSFTLQDFDFEVVGSKDNGEEALIEIEKKQPDLVLLDIDLAGKMTGIEVAEKLRPMGIPYVFLTAMSDPSTIEKAKVTNPYAYLVKPVKPETLLPTIEISLYNAARKPTASPDEATPTADHRLQETDSIFVKAKRRLERIKLQDILWVEAEDIYTIVITKTGKYILSQPLKNIELRFPESFSRIHRSYLVRVDAIQAIEENEVIIDGKHIPIGKTYRDKLMNRLEFM